MACIPMRACTPARSLILRPLPQPVPCAASQRPRRAGHVGSLRTHYAQDSAPKRRCPALPAAQRGTQEVSISGRRPSPDLDTQIRKAISESSALVQTNLAGVGAKTTGKVRDVYDDEGAALVFVTTDRQSAFDRVLGAVPFKGAVLNKLSAWWMQETSSFCPNALISMPDPNVSVMQKLDPLPIEFVVRGYITGSTSTSLWPIYEAGAREYCGNILPDGWVKNQKLPKNLLTPTTKSDDGDMPISPAEIVSSGRLSQADWDTASRMAMDLFEFGQKEVEKRGLILVDTKYEFGRDTDGTIKLIDEIHTPDSSRFWLQDSYESRMEAGEMPESIDKEFLRLWFRDNCDPYNDKKLPEAPTDLIAELSWKYIQSYEAITGQEFTLPSDWNSSTASVKRIQTSVEQALATLG